ILPEPLSEKDLPELERRMKRILKRRFAFEREELPVDAAIERLEGELNQPRKAVYARRLSQEQDLDTLSFYKTDGFVDLCRGPHIEHTGQLPRDAFKLRSLAGAYWLGDSHNEQMMRIYGWAFETKEELDAYAEARAQALERDHRKLGRELDIFVIDDTVG